MPARLVDRAPTETASPSPRRGDGRAVRRAPSDAETARITAAAARGDRAALARLHDLWFDFLLLEARRAVPRVAEEWHLDVVQDVFVRLLRSGRAFPTRIRFEAWLRAVVRSCALDRLRAERRRRNRERVAGRRIAAPPDADGELRAALRAEIARADPRDAALLVYRYRFGWTLERIGAVLGLSAGAVDGRLRRARERLRHALPAEGDGPNRRPARPRRQDR